MEGGGDAPLLHPRPHCAALWRFAESEYGSVEGQGTLLFAAVAIGHAVASQWLSPSCLNLHCCCCTLQGQLLLLAMKLMQGGSLLAALHDQEARESLRWALRCAVLHMFAQFHAGWRPTAALIHMWC